MILNVGFILFAGKEYITLKDGSGLWINCGYPKPEYEDFWRNYQNYIAMADYSVLPFFAMFIMNMVILKKLRSRDRSYKSIASVNKSATMKTQTSKTSLDSTSGKQKSKSKGKRLQGNCFIHMNLITINMKVSQLRQLRLHNVALARH